MPTHAAPPRRRLPWSWLAALVAVAALVLLVRPAVGGSGRAAEFPPGAPPATPAITSPAAAPRVQADLDPTPTRPAAPKRAQRPASRDSVTGQIPWSASGQLALVPGRETPLGDGRALTYRLEIEKGLPLDGSAVAAEVHRVLADPRGWQPIEHVAFSRTDGAASFELILASPALTDRLCYPLDTIGQLSCRNGDRVILNAQRWATAVPWYGGRIHEYRAYLVNHEVGHRLGHVHVPCPAAGAPAPVMMQQSKGVGACRPNPWPSVAAG